MITKIFVRTFLISRIICLIALITLTTSSHAADWTAVNNLVAEQQYAAAEQQITLRLTQAKTTKNATEWARALIELTKLQMEQGKFLEAAQLLRQQDWPEDQKSRVILSLYNANAIATYLEHNSWEIRDREKIESQAPLTLKKMTISQLANEVNQSFAQAWAGKSLWENEETKNYTYYFQAGTYPDSVRGRFRDMLTYMWVEFLDNTRLWLPTHYHQTPSLRISTLLSASGNKQPTAISDLRIHPLIRSSVLLNTLKQWHREHKRPEAMLEASRVHIETLYPHFHNDDKRQQLIQVLQQQSAAHKTLPWSTMLQWALAKFKQKEHAADVLIKTKKVLGECVKAHKNSQGNKRCQALLDQITHPSFSMESMVSDGMQKRSIRVKHKNIKKLYFRAWKVGLDNYIKWESGDAKRQNQQLENYLKRNAADAKWQKDLPATRDYYSHYTYITPPIQENGLWLIAAADEPSFNQEKSNISSVHLNLSPFVAEVKSLSGIVEVTGYGGENGQLIPGAKVEMLDEDNKIVASAITNQRGKVKLKPGTRGKHVIVLRHQGASTFADNIYSKHYSESSLEERDLIFTDRSIYRPGQTLQWKVITYQGNTKKGDFRVLPGAKGWVKLYDARGTEIAHKEVQTDHYGSAAGSFSIKAGAVLGDWSIKTSWTEFRSNHRFKVEEYKRPTFEVKFNATKQALHLGQQAIISGEAHYLFGQPVTDAEVKWRITRGYDYGRHYWHRNANSGMDTLISGTAKPDKQGRFTIKFTPQSRHKSDKSPIYRFRIEADVTDSGGETRSGSRSWRIGHSAIKADMKLDSAFVETRTPLAVDINRSDLNDVPRAGQGHWVLHQLKQPAKPVLPADKPDHSSRNKLPYATAGDKLRPRWSRYDYNQNDLSDKMRDWADGAVFSKGTLNHDETGQATATLNKLPAGSYRLRYTTKDKRGKVFETHRELVVVSPQATTLPLPIVLQLKESRVEVGTQLELLVGSGFSKIPVTVDFYHGDQHIQSNVISGGVRKMSFPVTKDYRGGLQVRASAVKDFQYFSRSEDIVVPWSDRKLDVSFSTFRDKLKPGQKETWRVTVKDPHGRPLQKGMAQIVASMYDKSLDVFTAHRRPSVLSLYRQQPTRLSLGTSQGYHRGYYFSSRPEPGEIGALHGLQLTTFTTQLQHNHPSIPGCTDSLSHSHKNGSRKHDHRYSCRKAAPAPRMAPIANYQKMAAPAVEAVAKTRDIHTKGAPAQPDPTKVRTNFNETAFFYPNLILGDNGSVIFEFEVPESLTQWQVWATAITRDLRGGSASETTRTSKDLMVRPYLPRFLREGDQAEIEVVINNTSEKDLTGQLDFDIIDPDSKQSRAADFKLTRTQQNYQVKAGESSNLRFPIVTPKDPGLIAIRTQATAGKLSDGEQRPLAILPSRMHLIESRFTVLNDNKPKVMTFPKLAKTDDPSREHDKLVINVEGQLFYSVLNALPYLVEYPYECTEQTLNRYLSTSIVQSAFAKNPNVAAVMKQLAKRDTRTEVWDKPDANRSLLLEETPWLNAAQGGKQSKAKLINILDAENAAKQRESALEKLRESQTESGGFPWWAGGPASPTITLYQLKGFARALEFNNEIPKDMVQAAWKYLQGEYKDKLGKTAHLRQITMISYLLTAYPDTSWTGQAFSPQQKQQMLQFAFLNRSNLSLQMKVYLALALQRSKRQQDAKLVLTTVMDGAKTDELLGTYWEPEPRSWLWYRDSTVTHALILRALAEMAPQDKRLSGMVQWLLLDKKLSHWKSTRATAESVYALTYYLQQEKRAFQQETATVRAGTALQKTLAFKPGVYEGGTQQVVVEGEKIQPDMAKISVQKQSNGPLPMFASASWHYSTEKIPEQGSGDFLNVNRRFYKRVHKNNKWTLQPLQKGAVVKIGDEVEVQLVLNTKQAADYVHLRSPRGAGFEPMEQASGFRWGRGVGYYQEIRDSGANYFFESLPAGKQEFRYRLRATTTGQFRVAPATLQSIYAPEFTAYSRGMKVQVHK